MLLSVIIWTWWEARVLLEDNGVLKIPHSSLETLLTNNNYAVILFKSRHNDTNNEKYWMSFSEASEIMNNSLPKVVFGYLDMSMLSPIVDTFNITQIPALRLYVHYPYFTEYSGDLNPKSISSWIRKIVNEPAVKLENLANLEEVQERGNPMVVYIGKINTQTYTKFQEVTRSMHRDHEISFCYVNIETAPALLLKELK